MFSARQRLTNSERALNVVFLAYPADCLQNCLMWYGRKPSGPGDPAVCRPLIALSSSLSVNCMKAAKVFHEAVCLLGVYCVIPVLSLRRDILIKFH